MPCSRGVLSQHALQQGGSAPGGSAPGGGLVEPPGRLLLRTVRILLECILVWKNIGAISDTMCKLKEICKITNS